MRLAFITLLGCLALATAAECAPGQRLYVTSNIRERPTVSVFLGDYPEDLLGRRFEFQWTANGQAQPPNLNGLAQCITRSAQQYSCEALKNWFGDAPRVGGRKPVRSGDPEAFYLPDMEWDTEYCFHFRDQVTPWSDWSCARTPVAPERPAAPGRPQVTPLPASSGSGVVGGGEPARILVEWQGLPDETLVAGYVVERQQYGRWNDWAGMPADGHAARGQAQYEETMEFPQGSDPNASYLFRVCAYNISGPACSLPGRTPAQSATEPVRPGGKAASIPRAGDRFDAPARPHVEAPPPAAKTPPIPDFDASSLDDLAAKGEAIAKSDLRSAALRDLQPEGDVRRGFDIGMAATVTDTAWGPGKQKLLDTLSAGQQEGFKVAVSFSLDRNRYRGLAAVGEAIAQADAGVAQARTREADPRYWLGFDIATGLFGDPARGAQGNTAMGPGSMAIRDALSAPAQRGFNDAVSLHLSRKY